MKTFIKTTALSVYILTACQHSTDKEENVVTFSDLIGVWNAECDRNHMVYLEITTSGSFKFRDRAFSDDTCKNNVSLQSGSGTLKSSSIPHTNEVTIEYKMEENDYTFFDRVYKGYCGLNGWKVDIKMSLLDSICKDNFLTKDKKTKGFSVSKNKHLIANYTGINQANGKEALFSTYLLTKKK